MKKSDKAMSLLLEFFGSIALSLVVYSSLRWTGIPLYRALAVGLAYGAILAVARPWYLVQLNPIVTIGLWTARRLSNLRAAVTVAVQLAGGWVAWQMTEFFIDQRLRQLAGDEFSWRIFAAEAAGAFIFTLLLAMVLFKRKIDEVKLVFVATAALTIGVVIASIAQGAYGTMNPSIAIGVQTWSWTYVLGPLVGGFVGMNLPFILTLLDGTSKTKKPAKTVTKKAAKKKSKTTKKK